MINEVKKAAFVSFLVCSLNSPLTAQIPVLSNQDDIQILNMNSFAELRSGILNLISGAKQRIWLVSDYLTDGEIVTALYIGKYRGVDTKVLLGKRKSNMYMSRLRYLKNQNIPVFYKPEKFPSGYPSQVLVDGSLYKISGELNFLDKSRAFKIQKGTKIELDNYIEEFQKATMQGSPEVSETVPLVGKAKHNAMGQPLAAREPVHNLLPPPREAPYVNMGETYNYDRSPSSRSAPEGLARKLPSKTIAQERSQNPPKPMTPTPDPAINRSKENLSEPIYGDQP